MKGKTQTDSVGRLRCLSSLLMISLFSLIFLLFWDVTARAQIAHPPYGATSAQDQGKGAASAIPATVPVTATASADLADQVCARFAAGAVEAVTKLADRTKGSADQFREADFSRLTDPPTPPVCRIAERMNSRKLSRY